MTKIIAVVSGKGGTGKSTISAALALALASLGKSVLAADLDAGLRSLDLLLAMENRVVYDLGDVFSGRCELSAAMAAHGEFPLLKLLCAPSLPVSAGREEILPELIGALRLAAQGFEYAILDLPAGLGFAVPVARELADLAVVVATPDLVTMRDARRTVDVLFSEGRKPCRLVINKVSRETMLAGGLRDLDEMMDTVGVPLLGVIPTDHFINSPLSGKRNCRCAELTREVFRAMARRINGEYIPLLLRVV